MEYSIQYHLEMMNGNMLSDFLFCMLVIERDLFSPSPSLFSQGQLSFTSSFNTQSVSNIHFIQYLQQRPSFKSTLLISKWKEKLSFSQVVKSNEGHDVHFYDTSM